MQCNLQGHLKTALQVTHGGLQKYFKQLYECQQKCVTEGQYFESNFLKASSCHQI